MEIKTANLFFKSTVLENADFNFSKQSLNMSEPHMLLQIKFKITEQLGRTSCPYEGLNEHTAG
jgi:hypothetical protein